MADKVLINLATGLEDSERVTIAFLTAGAALDRGREVAMFLTKEAVRLCVPGVAVGVACDGCPPLERVFQQFAEKGGHLLACPFCVTMFEDGVRALNVEERFAVKDIAELVADALPAEG